MMIVLRLFQQTHSQLAVSLLNASSRLSKRGFTRQFNIISSPARFRRIHHLPPSEALDAYMTTLVPSTRYRKEIARFNGIAKYRKEINAPNIDLLSEDMKLKHFFHGMISSFVMREDLAGATALVALVRGKLSGEEVIPEASMQMYFSLLARKGEAGQVWPITHRHTFLPGRMGRWNCHTKPDHAAVRG